jgi:SRSO17 transposase
VDNCQVGVSISAASDEASCPINWRIFIPPEWDEDAERRAKAHVPEDVRHREKWRLALDMIDEARTWRVEPEVVATDAGYGDITAFRQGLTERAIDSVVQVKAGTSAYEESVVPERPQYSGRGRPPAARYRQAPSSLKQLVLQAAKHAATGVSWRQGSRRRMHSRFVALRVRPANIDLRRAAHDADRELEVCCLLAEWPSDAPAPTDYWLSNLPADTPLRELVRLAKARWRIEHDYRELKDARPGPLRGPQLPRLEPPRHARLGRPRLPDPGTPAPANRAAA